jgi:3-hydroxyacyl-CoA dehydrogenase/enoyl-CoA hydratase/3-hydroxybutyryl-CoA epimerase
MARKAWGSNPALFRVIDVVERGMREGMESGLAMEAKVFGDLAISGPTKNLLFVERMRREQAAYSGPWHGGVGERDVRLAGVVGGGKTGAGVIYLLTDKSIRTRFKEISPEKVSMAFREIASLHRSNNREKVAVGKEFERKMDNVTGTTDYRGFGRMDLVIETIPEEISAKKAAFKELEERIEKSCIIATAISSLSLFDLASDMSVPTRLVGLHFFHPVHTVPFLEIVEGEWTDRYATRTVFNLFRKLGKMPIVVKDTPGFLVNRIRMALINESFLLLEEGNRVEAIDRALVDFGFHLGPFQLIDQIGVEVASKAAAVMNESFGPRLPLSKAFRVVLSATQRGVIHSFYIDKGKGSTVNPQLYLEIGRSPETGVVTGSLRIQNRLLNAMLNEAVICLEDGVVARPEDIELGTLLGMRFPSFRGGLLRYADQHGIGRIVDELEVLTASRGAKRQPADTLVKMAKAGNRFFK